MQCAIQCTNCTQKSELKFLMKMLEHILIPHCFTAEEGFIQMCAAFCRFHHTERDGIKWAI